MSDCVNSESSRRNSLLSSLQCPHGPILHFTSWVAIRAAPPAARPQNYKPVNWILSFLKFLNSLPVPVYLTCSAVHPPFAFGLRFASTHPESFFLLPLPSFLPPSTSLFFKQKLMTHCRRMLKETGCVMLVCGIILNKYSCLGKDFLYVRVSSGQTDSYSNKRMQVHWAQSQKRPLCLRKARPTSHMLRRPPPPATSILDAEIRRTAVLPLLLLHILALRRSHSCSSEKAQKYLGKKLPGDVLLEQAWANFLTGGSTTGCKM